MYQHLGDKATSTGKRPEAGFTLLELLVVIAIITTLAAFLITGVTNMLSISRQEATRSLIKQLENGLEAYKSDFQDVPEVASEFTVEKGGSWTTISYSSVKDDRSAQLHGALGAKLRFVSSTDPATGSVLYGEAGPYIKTIKAEDVQNGNIDNYRAPFVDAWNNVLFVRYGGKDHSSNGDCGSRNNKDWVDIWSEGPEIEGANDGCGDDDINNFGGKD